ncbi:hypothetical protein OU997_13870 [Pseudomonas sp. SL4(2022)]|uniref:hypothetical protein n=1 Tax=Pseudomonas sp. SL4(2022) TaxID=2994661 RepID=UPI00226F441A|nr:hypothetical protein [Pseudomonas sp. SL4(2022)]WAC43362.1 hypothetical protein OU997_13870 [Pseudomonas sp. SL4(2022)]
MAGKTCFVVMAIGNQTFNGEQVSSSDLKAKYDSLIKEAILKARPRLEVVRADEVSVPGTITTDIITRLMHSDYVVADVTYPNPNVFYELGLRHACKVGTIIIRDKAVDSVPFDIAHLRYIEYTNTTLGLKELATQLGTYFDHFDKQPERPDNHFLELAKLTGYAFPDYKKEEDVPLEMQAFMGLLDSPELLSALIQQGQGGPVDEMETIRLLMSNPKVAQPFIQGMVKSGQISFAPKSKKPSARKK